MLERELRELRPEWPPTPNLASAVAERLDAPRRRRLPSWPAWQVAAAAAAVAIAVVLAVPPARSAVLDWLGFGSVRIERAEPRPSRYGIELDLGEPVTLAAARRAVGFPIGVPAALGEPDAVFLAPDRVDFVYRPGDGLPRLLVTQLPAVVTPLIEKTAGMGTRVERLRVGADPAFFLSGAEHGFAYLGADGAFEPQRLAGNTLLVERADGVLLRVEGDVTRAQAARIAGSAG